jgi:hypothetical protein
MTRSERDRIESVLHALRSQLLASYKAIGYEKSGDEINKMIEFELDDMKRLLIRTCLADVLGLPAEIVFHSLGIDPEEPNGDDKAQEA